jgi:DNA-binding transcriptional regulator YbjK
MIQAAVDRILHGRISAEWKVPLNGVKEFTYYFESRTNLINLR